jgi:transcription elongation factor GreA
VFGATSPCATTATSRSATRSSARPKADARHGRISYDSPMGRALIGKQVGEEVEVTVPSGDRFYLVDKIEFI